MEKVQPLSGFRQFTKTEAVAIMEAKTSKLSATFERELRNIEEKIRSDVRETVKDQLELLLRRIEQNATDIRSLMGKQVDEVWKKQLDATVQKNTENINLIDNNIKSLDNNIRSIASS